MASLKQIFLVTTCVTAVSGLAGQPTQQLSGGVKQQDLMSRLSFCRRMSALAVALPLMARAEEYTTTASGLQYKLSKGKGIGENPKAGDLIAIRFKGSYDGRVFDDIMETPEPLYYRVGAGTLIPGIDEALPLMKLGETFTLLIPGNLGFGPKGRPASAGKPRIPSNADLVYDISIVGFPGFEGDLIDTL